MALWILKVKAGQRITDDFLQRSGPDYVGGPDTVVYAYMDWDLPKYSLHGLDGLDPDDQAVSDVYGIITTVVRMWPSYLKAMVNEIVDCADTGRKMWPEETEAPVDVMKTDGYVVYVFNDNAYDLRCLIAGTTIRMDHKSTRGLSADDLFADDALPSVYRAGFMISDIWLHMRYETHDAREQGRVLKTSCLLDLS